MRLAKIENLSSKIRNQITIIMTEILKISKQEKTVLTSTQKSADCLFSKFSKFAYFVKLARKLFSQFSLANRY